MFEEGVTKIQTIFSDAKRRGDGFSPKNDLENVDPSFVSVAYEGASMGIGLKSIIANNGLSSWLAFYNSYKHEHGSQLCVGLGWAYGELNTSPAIAYNYLTPSEQLRLLDGLGYYFGLFNRRLAVRRQEFPDYISVSDLSFFDQGLGRCLWYLSGGSPQKLKRFIDLYSTERKKDLWRGAGIALAYVGGVNQSAVLEVKKLSVDCSPSLSIGVLLALCGRKKARTLGGDNLTLAGLFINDIPEAIEAVQLIEERDFESRKEYLTVLTAAIQPFLST